ncbi:hypothetical protein C2G38_679887 [Gigaspora rosea]|uniref:Uncharacterized protein n=1 Tax=Gigaspora rosea TaxID=44941 RepID=A0A397U2J4_9GLOM|nr:hypothetical protein C2G38_679887 [Gigaspora rosea]
MVTPVVSLLQKDDSAVTINDNDNGNHPRPSTVKNRQRRVERFLKKSRARNETGSHVNKNRSEKKEKMKPIDVLPKVGLENESQKREKPKNGEQEVPRK